MVNSASRVDWVTVANEVEALQVEYSWIKEYDPRFNVRYRDDKSYPYLAVTMNEQFPRVQVMRDRRSLGFATSAPMHTRGRLETVDQLLRVFPMRSCSKGSSFDISEWVGPACLVTLESARHHVLAEWTSKNIVKSLRNCAGS